MSLPTTMRLLAFTTPSTEISPPLQMTTLQFRAVQMFLPTVTKATVFTMTVEFSP